MAARRAKRSEPWHPRRRFGLASSRAASRSLVPVHAASRRRLLSAGAIVATGCGIAGYLVAGQAPLDALYNTLLLFTATYTSPSSATGTPPLLQIARYGALVVAFATVAAAFAAFFRGHVDAFAAGHARAHVVLCGLGELGIRIAVLLRDHGHVVIGVAPEVEQVTASRLRRAGVSVIAGDPQDPVMLKRVRVDRARYLLALDAPDDINAGIVALASRCQAPGDGGRLACLAHVRDLALCERLRELSLHEKRTDLVTVDFVNADESAAQDLLARHSDTLLRSEPLHVLLVEPSLLGAALVLQVSRARAAEPDAGHLAVTVAGRQAGRWWEEIIDTWPELAATAPVALFAVDLRQRALADIATKAEQKAGLPVHFAAVCAADHNRSLLLGLALGDNLPGVPIAVRADGARGLGRSLADQASAIQLIDTVTSLLRPEVLLADVYVMLAREAHADYVKQQLSRGAIPFSRPPLRPWDELTESLKSSNIDQARYMVENLRVSGYDLRRAGTTTSVIELDEPTVERLAEREHERWARERRRNSYRWGRARDEQERRHPDLVPWAALPDGRRELDREVIHNYAKQAARIGYQIVRVDDHQRMSRNTST